MSGEATIVGAGLAGSEAALVLSSAGVPVRLVEMRPAKGTPAHETGWFAELVCSNSLGSTGSETGKGLLKAELALYGSPLLSIAETARVPAGKALAVDRALFGRRVTEEVRRRGNVRVVEAEAESIPDDPLVILAPGPLVEGSLSESIRELLGGEGFYFYDAIAPIVEASSIDAGHAFAADRWSKGAAEGEGDYLNLPLTEAEYDAFHAALVGAAAVPARPFEDPRHFEGCMPVETLASRGKETLLYGPMRPVGIRDPRTGERPFAVVQLRRENAEGTMYNLVGFQTKLTYPEQRRVFSMIPALRHARFLRYGSVHRNSYVDGAAHLLPTLETRARRGLWIAGQLSGVEGYAESIASGFAAAVALLYRRDGKEGPPWPRGSMLGGLLGHVTSPRKGDAQPMNANFGLLPEPAPGKKKERKERQARAALEAAARFREEFLLPFPGPWRGTSAPGDPRREEGREPSAG